MSTNDPFAAFASDRTVIKPNPGGRPVRLPETPAAAPPPPASDAFEPGADDPFSLGGSLNPLADAAAPLLQLVPRVRAMAVCPDPVALRDTIARMVRRFETQAREQGLPEAQVTAARYMLCTFIDEAAASTPWGAGVWSKHSLLVMFHNETWGGEKVFQLMARLAEQPAAQQNLLELAYLVLSLGFEGRYRVVDNGRQQVDRVRAQLHQMLVKLRGAPEGELSPRWQGVATTRARVTDTLPVWVVGALALTVLALVYLGLGLVLNRASDPVFGRMAGLRVPVMAAPVVPPAPPAPAQPRLATFLAPEIQAGQVAVDDQADRSVITVRGDGFFEPASATVAARVKPLLARIAAALNSVPGQVQVTGHTDSQPIRSMRYPSNWHLSQDRADAVKALLADTVQESRLQAVGKADAEPLAPNDTAPGRARNRRVEITLFMNEPSGAQAGQP